LGFRIERLPRSQEIQGLSLFKFKSKPLSSEIGVFLCLDSGLDSGYSGVLTWKDIALFYIAGPVWMAVFGCVFFVIFAAIYNLLARRLGGIEVELNDE